jgi:LPS-assembly protein
VPGKSATIHRGVFRLRGVPMFYFPVFRKSLERLPRESGFLTPNIGNSSRFGFVLGQSYFWAINRSYDATIGGTWYTNRGLASQVAFRGRPTAASHFDAVFFGVKDRGQLLDDGTRGEKQGGASASVRGAAQLPGGFRGVTQINYLSSLEFRQVFTQTFEEAVSSQIRSIGFISKNQSTFSMNVSLLRDENFQSVDDPENTVVLRNLPSMEFNSHERQIVNGPLPVWFSLDSSFGLVSRTQPQFQTRRFVQRGDFYPRISTKLAWKDFHLTPTFGARHTSYGQRREQSDLIGTNLYRNTKEFSLELAPPSLQRIYDGPKWLGEKIKHVIEPRVIYRYVDGVENFARVIRFDERDIVNTTNEMDVSLINRVYAKDQSGRVREVFALEVWQRRYFDPDFGGALVPGQRNVFQSTIGITPFAFADQNRHSSPIVTSMRVQPNWRYRLEWRNDYDKLRGKLVNSSVSADMRLTELWSISAGHSAVRAPTALSPPSNQLSTIVRLGDFNRRGWNAAVNTIYDYRQKIFLYNVSQITYNTDCCGFSVEWRRLALGATRNENQFRVSLSIANVGSFGTLRPQERLF